MRIVLIIILLLFASLAQAENAYRWEGKDGKTYYGSKPPKNAKNVEKLKGEGFSKYSTKKLIKTYESKGKSTKEAKKN